VGMPTRVLLLPRVRKRSRKNAEQEPIQSSSEYEIVPSKIVKRNRAIHRPAVLKPRPKRGEKTDRETADDRALN